MKYYQKEDVGFDYNLSEDGYRNTNLNMPADISFIGAAQTFGRFVHNPFPDKIASSFNISIYNFGKGGMGPNDCDILKNINYVNSTKLCVIQVLSGRSSSCSKFISDGGCAGYSLYHEKNVRCEDFWKFVIKHLSSMDIQKLVEETLNSYIKSYENIIRNITVPTLLLYIGKAPKSLPNPPYNFPHELFQGFPQFIDMDTLDKLKEMTNFYEGLVYNHKIYEKLEYPTVSNQTHNAYYPTQDMHDEVAEKIKSRIVKERIL